MKKLMICFAIAACAVAAQASVAKWSVMNLQDSPAATASAGWMVSIFEGAASSFSFDDFKAGTLTAADTVYGVKNATTGFINAQNTTGFGDYTPDTSHTFYAVVFDAASLDDVKYYIVSSEQEKKFAANGSAQSWAFGNMALTTTANKFAGATWTQAVPEPTSGLLLLLGVAGLALRRRRA